MIYVNRRFGLAIVIVSMGVLALMLCVQPVKAQYPDNEWGEEWGNAILALMYVLGLMIVSAIILVVALLLGAFKRKRVENQDRGVNLQSARSLALVLGFSLMLEVVFAIIFYNNRGLTVLEYSGFVLVGLSLVIGWLARIEFTKKGGVPEGKSYVNTTALVNSGIYAVVRHPMYMSGIFLFFALTLISQHWLSVVFGAIPVALLYTDTWEEDKSLVVKFGEDYRKYMHKVPRVNIIVGVFRLLSAREDSFRASRF